MLAVSPFRDENHQKTTTRLSSMGSNYTVDTQEFPDFSDANLLIDGIDFDDLFTGIDGGDVLPDLETDPEILAEFSASSGGGDDQESSEMTTFINTSSESVEENYDNNPKEDDDKVSGSDSGSGLSKEEEIVSEREEPAAVEDHGDKQLGRSKSSSRSKKNNQGQRKVKVDWTPELHRRFVQAVEQLGVDKAVPSRILELMGIDCLTRHNIASHLQKYRSHRKHLQAREAEATSWNQRRQMYGAATVLAPPPTVGFRPMAHHHHFRPLHVWGHPTVDQLHMWHRPSPSPPPPPQPHSQPVPVLPRWHQQQLSPGTPCFAQSCMVPGVPPHHQAMYNVEPPPGTGVPTSQSGPHPPVDFHPSKESIDAALREVLSKPCLPLPLGLKPPSVDGVIVELRRQGIRKIPPSSA